MRKPRHRFEHEIRLGLLAVIFVLVFLNSLTLYIVHQARRGKHQEAAFELRTAAAAVSREVQGRYPQPLSEQELRNLKHSWQLNSLYLVPSRPDSSSTAARRRWFMSITRHFHAAEISDLAKKLMVAEYHEPTRLSGNEYYYLYPVPAGAGHSLLIVSRHFPGLAFLDDAAERILTLGLVALGIIIAIVFVLYRFIVAPFRRIQEQAARAGRPVGRGEADANAVVEDYRRVIDELRTREAELRRLNVKIQNRAKSLEQFNQYLLRSMDAGLVTIDCDGNTSTVNDAAARILARDQESLQKSDYARIFDSSRELVAAIKDAVEGCGWHGYQEYRFPNAYGDESVIGVSISVIRDAADQPLGTSILFNDLTELVQLRSELASRQKMAALGEMSGGLAHQLRNTMGVITGYGRLARRKMAAAGLDTQPIESLVSEVDDATRMVGQFLTYARPFDLQRQPVGINELLQEVVESFAVRDDLPNCRLTLQTGANVALDIDPLLLKQALVNIIENAILAYPEAGGMVTIGSAVSSDGIEITVTDSGSGIPDDVRHEIFTPFVSSRASGTGLGLPLAQKIVDAHDGAIGVRTEANVGTTFTVSLPHAAESQAHMSQPSASFSA